MNVTTRAHFHVRIVELLRTLPVGTSAPREWLERVGLLLTELAPLLEPAVEPVQPAVTLRDKIAIEAMKVLMHDNAMASAHSISCAAYVQADNMLQVRGDKEKTQ